MDKYQQWIQNNVTHTYGKCEDYTKKMQAEFPHLTRIRGHYHCPVWGKRAHWWLVTEDSEIIDPTAKQFPSGGIKEFYIPHQEGDPEPTGKCLNCGEYTYNSACFCCETCRKK